MTNEDNLKRTYIISLQFNRFQFSICCNLIYYKSLHFLRLINVRYAFDIFFYRYRIYFEWISLVY